MKLVTLAALAALHLTVVAGSAAAASIAEATVKAGDLDMHYLHAGSGPVTVVLLHGWPESSHEWRKVMPLLAARYRVVAPDLRGIGGTAAPADGYDKATMARDIHTLIGARKPGKVVLVGHDIGGQVAYAYLRQFPQDVAGVAIFDVPLPGIAPWDKIKTDPRAWHFGFNVQSPLAEELAAGREAKLIRYFVNEIAVNPKAVSDEDVAAFAEAYRAPDHLRAGFSFYRAFPQDETFNAAQTSPVTTPVLLAGADHSMGPMEETVAAALRAKGVRDVTTAVIPNSGHWIAEEQPEVTAKLISDFADRVTGALMTPAALRPAPIDEAAFAVALDAFDKLDHGARTGEWEDFLACLHDHLTWFGPVDGFQGLQHGKASATELFKHHAAVTRTHWNLKNVVANGPEIGFECWTQGEIEGKSYGNQLFMLFVIEGGLVRHFREYAGYIGGVGDFTGKSRADDGADAHDYRRR